MPATTFSNMQLSNSRVSHVSYHRDEKGEIGDEKNFDLHRRKLHTIIS